MGVYIDGQPVVPVARGHRRTFAIRGEESGHRTFDKAAWRGEGKEWVFYDDPLGGGGATRLPPSRDVVDWSRRSPLTCGNCSGTGSCDIDTGGRWNLSVTLDGPPDEEGDGTVPAASGRALNVVTQAGRQDVDHQMALDHAGVRDHIVAALQRLVIEHYGTRAS
jgi:hypothetical protein